MSDRSHLEQARQTLETLRLAQRRIELTAAILRVMAITIPIWLVGIVIESLFKLSAGAERGWLAFVMVIAPLSLLTMMLIRVLRDLRLKPGRAAEEYWALELGKTAPDKLRDRLLNAIQIARHTPRPRDQFSTNLASQALYLAVADLQATSVAAALNHTPHARSFKVLATSCAVAILALLLFRIPIYTATARLAHPFTEYSLPPPFTLTVTSEADWAYRNEPVKFTVAAAGQAPREVVFTHRFAGGQPQETRIALSNGAGTVDFAGFAEDVYYSARAGDVTSPEKKLDIVTRPQITELQVKTTPPRYSGLPPVVGAENVGDVEGLAGSAVELNIRANKPLAGAWMVRQSATSASAQDSISFEVRERDGSLRFTLQRELDYEVRLRDRDGHPDRDPVTYHLKITPDQPPTVAIVVPGGDIDLGDAMAVPLLVEAYDDFAVARLELAYRRLEQDSIPQAIPLPTQSASGKSVQVQTVWNLGSEALMPGDVVEYWAIAWDNDVVSGPKRTESERRLIRLPSIEEIISDVAQTEDAGLDQAEQMLKSAQELRDEAEKIALEMKRNPEPDWQRQKAVESAIESQQALQKQADELSQKIQELTERLEKHDMASLETLQKYAELQKLLSEVATPELKKAMEDLRKAMEAQDPDQLRQAMEQFDFNREQFLENIERTLNILKELQLERRLDELAKRTTDLLHRQEDVLSQMKREEAPTLAGEQQRLGKETQALQKDISETAKAAQDAGQTELATSLDSLANAAEAKQTPAKMQQAAQALTENRIPSAQALGEQSARDLSELSGGLKQAAQQFREQRKAALAGKVRRLTEELLYLSSTQEKLSASSERLGTESPSYPSLAGEQQDVRSALDGVTQRLFDVSKETFFITPDLGEALGAAAQDIDRALQAFAGRSPRGMASPQKKALGEINGAARQLLMLLGQMEGSSSASGFEEMMQRLSQMASAQQGINQQSLPMFGPQGESSMPSMAQQMAQMAAQQRALEQQMQQAAQEAQGMQEILGDLQDIAGKMGDVAKDFDDRNLSERTKRLQQQIVNRLLDATRSAREEEYSKERESRSGQQFARRSPPALDLEAREHQLHRDLLRALQEGYTSDYRELIRQYFQALEKTQPAGQE